MHRMGNSPKCGDCLYFKEVTDEDLKIKTVCTNAEYLKRGINGRTRKNPPKEMKIDGCWYGCKWGEWETPFGIKDRFWINTHQEDRSEVVVKPGPPLIHKKFLEREAKKNEC